MPKKLTLRQSRAISGLTQVEMAQKLGITRDAYRANELYKVIMRMDRAKKFSQIVDIPIQDIIFLPDN